MKTSIENFFRNKKTEKNKKSFGTFLFFQKYKKIYYSWKTRRRIRKSIHRSYKDLFVPLSSAAKAPSLLFLSARKSNKKSSQLGSCAGKLYTLSLKVQSSLRYVTNFFTPTPKHPWLGSLVWGFNALSLEFSASHFARLKSFIKKFSTRFAMGGKNYVSRTFWKRAVAVITVLVVVANVYVQNSEYSSGATYVFDQTQWRGTPTGDNAAHPGDQSSFTDYTSKSANISLTGGAGPYKR